MPVKGIRVGEYVDDTLLCPLFIQVLEKHNGTGFVCLDLFCGRLGELLQAVKFAFLDLEVTDENDWLRHHVLLSETKSKQARQLIMVWWHINLRTSMTYSPLHEYLSRLLKAMNLDKYHKL